MGILKKFLNLIDLSRPQSVLFVLGSGLFIFAIVPFDWINNSPYNCLWKAYIIPFFFKGHCPTTGLFMDCNCPGCGMTRALWQILHGNFNEAFSLNHLSPLVFVLIISLLSINIYKLLRREKL